MRTIKCILVLLTSLAVYAQEHPPVMAYTPDTYSAQNQNWSISQDIWALEKAHSKTNL